MTPRTNWRTIRILLAGAAASLLFWMADSVLEYFRFEQNLDIMLHQEPLTLLDALMLNVPPHALFVRTSFAAACMTAAILLAFYVNRQKMQSQALERSEAKYRSLVENTPDLILRLDAEGRCAFASRNAAAYTGVEAEEMVGKSADELSLTCTGLKGLPTLLLRGLQRRGPVQRQVQIESSGIARILNIRVIPALSDAQDIESVLVIVRDVTKEAQLEDQLHQTQKMEAVGELAGGVAHDFNNILQVVIGYSEMALSDLDAKRLDQVHGSIEEVYKGAQRAQQLVRQLLLFSRREAARPGVADLNVIVQELMKMLNRVLGENMQTRFEPARDLPNIYADRHQVEQILMNIALNSRDAMPDGGTIRIATDHVRLTTEDAEAVPWAQPGEYVVLIVSDDGCGMGPEIRDRIFEPFFTTKSVGKGTGLGLATVYGIVQQHGGFIKVDTEVGQGAAFTIFFPASTDNSEVEAHEDLGGVPGGSGEIILLAEDDESVRRLGASILSNAGYEVVTASNGEQAVRAFEQRPDDFDLAVLDAVMPVRSGKEVFTAMRATRPDIPVLFASGYSYRVLELGDISPDKYDLVAKPFRAVELLGKVRTMLDRTRVHRPQ